MELYTRNLRQESRRDQGISNSEQERSEGRKDREEENPLEKHYLKMLSLYITLCMPILKSNHIYSIRQSLATYLMRNTKGNTSC